MDSAVYRAQDENPIVETITENLKYSCFISFITGLVTGIKAQQREAFAESGIGTIELTLITYKHQNGTVSYAISGEVKDYYRPISFELSVIAGKVTGTIHSKYEDNAVPVEFMLHQRIVKTHSYVISRSGQGVEGFFIRNGPKWQLLAGTNYLTVTAVSM